MEYTVVDYAGTANPNGSVCTVSIKVGAATYQGTAKVEGLNPDKARECAIEDALRKAETAGAPA